jgi:F420-dependent oxidoreductase-like protein
MRIGIPFVYDKDFFDAVERLADFQRAGASLAYVAELYSFDAVSQLGYIAAKIPGLEIASNILPIYSRTPALLAMTAAGLDYVSQGRFTLGLGASGPQVIEGFHGVPYDVPVARTRDVIAICRKVWRREPLKFASERYSIPLSPERGGSGMGKALRLINYPVRERIPILIAAMGERNVSLVAELAEGWAPFFFLPERANEVWGDALSAGYAKRDPSLPPLDIVAPAYVAIGDHVDHYLDLARPMLALYLGGMGARGKNFYNDLARRFGFDAEARRIQDLYLDGKKEEAAAAVPADLIRQISLIGPRAFVQERVKRLREAGVTTLSVVPLGADHSEQIRNVEALADIVG